MKISAKSRYALRLMTDIAENGQDTPVSLRDVAVRQEISMKYLESITALLVKAGLLESARGAYGGYRLALPADSITVRDILLAVEDPLTDAPCDAACPRAKECDARLFWNDLSEQTDKFLASVTLRDLLAKKKKKTQQNDVWML